MKTIRIAFTSFVICQLFCITSADAYAQDELQFTISLEKDTFLVDEPVYLEMLLTNISDHEVGILAMTTDASWEYMKIDLRNERDEPVDNHDGETIMAPQPEWWPGFVMAPGESWLLVKDLLSAFGQWGDPAHQFSLFLPAGRYSLQVIYHTNPKAYVGRNKRAQDKRTLVSNLLAFQVIVPGGREKSEHDEFLATMATYARELKNPERQVSQLTRFIARYSNSVYLPIVYHSLYITYTIKLGYTKERQALVSEVLTRFPNSGLTYDIIQSHRLDELRALAREPEVTKNKIARQLNFTDSTTRASFYAKCQVDMQRIAMRTRERVAQLYEQNKSERNDDQQ